MKKFVLRLVYKTLVLACSFIPVRSLRKERRNYYKAVLERYGVISERAIRTCAREVAMRAENLRNCAKKIEILALGSSHAQCAFAPSLFGDVAFNFGVPSGDLCVSKMMFSKLSSSLPKLKHVFVFFSVFTPGLNLIMTTGGWRAAVYTEVLGLPLLIRGDEKWLDGTLKPLERVKRICSSVREDGIESWKNEFDNGFAKSENTAPVYEEENRFLTQRENRRKPDQLTNLRELLSDARRKNIEILIVIPPMRKDYREKLPSKEELFGALSEFREETILDLYEDESFGSADFRDQDHLNICGARKLTEKLKEHLEHNEKK